MSEKIGQRILRRAVELLALYPDGLRYSELTRLIAESDPSFKPNTIHGNIWNLDARLSDKIYKPSRGLFRLVSFQDEATDQLREELITPIPPQVREEDFYAPFADWLVNEVEDCTTAIPLGGNRFRDTWGTPDVVGKRESKRSDILQAPVEIVSAEIKTETSQLVTAFGQACAYNLFSHKTYLVVPKSSPEDEIARLDSLAQVFGIGLVLFDVSNPEVPSFEIRVRPRRGYPDLFYANKYMKLLEKEMFS
jgi:hypothetical protein